MPTTRYIYNPLTEAYLMEQDGDGNTTVVYTQEPVKYGDILAQHRIDPATGVGKSYYYHPDALGSTRELTDESGTVVATYNYDAFGNTIASTGTVENPFRFTGNVGYYWDEELQTYHIRARNYEPTTGRWTSQDPIGFEGGINFYAAYFIPDGTDPSGMDCEFEICSSPVTFGTGHLFILIDGKGFRGGPSNSGPLNVNDFTLDPNPECECKDKPWGQLIGFSGTFDKTFPDHPGNGRGYPEAKKKCSKVSMKNKECKDLSDCFESVLSKLHDCCIPYKPVPVFGKLDGNSNSAVGWMLMSCVEGIKLRSYVPPDSRANPGLYQSLPPCMKESE